MMMCLTYQYLFNDKQTNIIDLTESHVKLRLWRQVSESEKYGVRRVRAMWGVRRHPIVYFYIHIQYI